MEGNAVGLSKKGIIVDTVAFHKFVDLNHQDSKPVHKCIKVLSGLQMISVQCLNPFRANSGKQKPYRSQMSFLYTGALYAVLIFL